MKVLHSGHLFLVLLFCHAFFGRTIASPIVYTPQKSFIENRGQYTSICKDQLPAPCLFSYQGDGENYFFYSGGFSIQLVHQSFRSKTDEQKKKRKEQKVKGIKTRAEFLQFEREGNLIDEKSEWMHYTFKGNNPGHLVSGEGMHKATHSFLVVDADGGRLGLNNVPGYKTVVYKNLYPGIDAIIEFHPQRGLEYSFRVSASGDPSKINLTCNRASILDEFGNRVIETVFGPLIEHKAKAWKEADKSVVSIKESLHPLQRTFTCEGVKKHEAVFIDPWIQTPSFNTNWDCVWECERDAAGNVYIIGGVMPMQLLKYDPAGNLQWTYNTPYDTAGVWLGTFATDLAGNSYITSGSTAAIQMVNTSGALVWDNPNPGGIFSNTEFWSIAFNCDQTKMLIGGTGGFINPEPWVFDVDMSNGNVITSEQVTGPGALIGIPPNTNEVRAVTATRNSKYYFLTHDSIGYISDNLGLCPNSSWPFHTNNDNYNLSYKCENWRYDNSGIEALAYFDDYVFVNRGNRLDKIAFGTAQVVQSVAIPGGGFTSTLGQNQVRNSGIDIDGCGTIYVGSMNAVHAFDQNLNPVANYAVTFNVYDIAVNSNGDVIACGSTGTSSTSSRTGYVQTISVSACAPLATVCCDASVCPPPSLCINDAPVQLSPNSSGGTWSGIGVSPTGVFDPGISGNGSFVITYTQPCGSDSVVIVVNPCTSLSVCIDTAGMLNVSGGSGPYTWSYFQPAGSTPITNQSECQACGFTWFFGTCLNGIIPVTTCNTAAGWVTWATGTSASAPPLFPAQVQDNAGTIFTIDSLGMLPACSGCPSVLASIQLLQEPLCFGETGSVLIQTVPSASSVVWQPGNLTGASQSALLAGAYQVIVADSSGCTDTLSVVLNEPTALSIPVTSAVQAGCDTATGSAIIQVLGGSAPYTSQWFSSGILIDNHQNIISVDTLSNVFSGNYTVIISDGNGCTTTDSVIVGSPVPPQLSLVSQSDASCGLADGSFIVSVSGNNGQSSLSWYNNGQFIFTGALVGQTDSLLNLNAGMYAVVVTDSANCSDSLTVQINNSNSAVISTSKMGALLCFGEDSVGVALSLSGGASPYSIVWLFGADTIEINSTSSLFDTVYVNMSGTISAIVSDQLGCISSQSVVVTGPTSAVSISSVSISNASCGASDGAITLNAGGGTGSLTYTWTPAVSSGNTATSLAAGGYIVLISDANACTVDTALVISNTDGPIVTIASYSNPSCAGLADGSISVSASGGTGPLLYSWTGGGGGGSTANGLGAGTYTVTVTDSLGCSGVIGYTLVDPEAVSAVFNSTPAACGATDGTAIISASGGTPPLTYQWSNGATTAMAAGFGPGTASVIVRDSLNCLFFFDLTIGSIGTFQADAGDSLFLFAGESGYLDATGPPGADFIWTPDEFVQCPTCSTTLVSPDSSTWYTVLVSLNGCTVSDSVWVRVETICGEAFLPTAFSPNNDGYNEVFYVRSRCLKDADFQIYDRWGRLMFQTNDLTKGWDGTFDGEAVQPGAYTWYLTATGNNKTISLKGNVTLMR